MKILFSALIGLGLASTPNAYAAQSTSKQSTPEGDFSNCTCVTANPGLSATIGKITSSKGDVLYSGIDGYKKSKSGSPLLNGSQVSVGDNASANLSVGSSCALNIQANSMVTIQQPTGITGDICVKVSHLDNTSTGLVQTGSSTQSGPRLPMAFVGGAVVAGAVIVVSGENSSSSP